jgi:uncharacterized protein YndB with AHSA1/START domain
MTTKSRTTDREVLITREYNAPRELVFKVWTEAEHLKNWYAPEGCSIEIFRFDFRPGGSFFHVIRNPVHDCWCAGVFREIEEPSKIVYDISITDQNGQPAQPVDMGMDPEWPATTTITILFEGIGNKTRITLHQAVSQNLAKRTGAYPSWHSMLDNLEKELTQALVP